MSVMFSNEAFAFIMWSPHVSRAGRGILIFVPFFNVCLSPISQVLIGSLALHWQVFQSWPLVTSIHYLKYIFHHRGLHGQIFMSRSLQILSGVMTIPQRQLIAGIGC